jgi:isoquinoline 1-oxidoreductase beta subunit
MVKRRTLLLGTGAAAATLVVGWCIAPPRQRLQGASRLPLAEGQSALNGWVAVGADNTVTIMMAKSEMGQGIHTGLAMLLCEELDADWRQVRVRHSPVDKIYNNLATVVDGLPFHPDDDGAIKRFAGWMTAKAMREFGVMMTGGSSSIKDLWLPMREAGASARAMLLGAAARQWKVPASECRITAGQVQHASGKTASFGQVAALAAAEPLPGKVSLKDPSLFRLIGQPRPRLEAPAKIDGSAVFGIDVRPPGMRYASVLMCPTLGGEVLSVDDSKAASLPGVRKIFRVGAHHGSTAGVAVIADRPYQALKAVGQLSVRWSPGPHAGLDTDQIMRRLSQTLDTEEGFAYFSRGDTEAALKTAARSLTAEYRAPYLAHAPMEPMNCTVQVKEGSATVWASTQVPGLARDAVAAVLGIPAEKVDVQVQLLGGGFGRRLDVDFIAQAAAIARENPGVAVQTLWTREQDMTHDFYRPACVSRFSAGLDANGQLLAWKNTSAGQAIVPQALKRLFGLPGAGPDKTSSEGAYDQPYEWPAARIAHEIVDLGVPVGFWRSVGHSHQAFFKECFLDEVAAASGQDPVALRRSLLKRHPRHLAVLNKAAQLAGWGKPPAPGPDGLRRALGIALHQSFGSIVAQVAEVSVTSDKAIRVHQVWCAIDCGIAVNPNLIRQQMESAIAFGLSAALFGEITIRQGQVQQSNFGDYRMLRMRECPTVLTEIMPSTAHPEGVGEPGTPPIAPAVANALFTLTGQRLRSLPLRIQ